MDIDLCRGSPACRFRNGLHFAGQSFLPSETADRYFDSGEVRTAEIEYENVLRVDPQNPRAWDKLGDIFFDEGRGPETVPVLLQAKQFDPTNLDVHLKLAASFLEFSQAKESAKEAAFVFSQNPRDDQAPLLLAAAATNDFDAIRLRLQLSEKGDSAGFANVFRNPRSPSK